jgi:predicted amidohydrolase YtcJ
MVLPGFVDAHVHIVAGGKVVYQDPLWEINSSD